MTFELFDEKTRLKMSIKQVSWILDLTKIPEIRKTISFPKILETFFYLKENIYLPKKIRRGISEHKFKSAAYLKKTPNFTILNVK